MISRAVSFLNVTDTKPDFMTLVVVPFV